MKRFKLVTLVSIATLFLTACGGGGSSDGNSVAPPPETKSYSVSTLDGAQNIFLGSNQNIIAGYGCTVPYIYNSNGDKFESDETLPAGDYTIVYNESYSKYTDSLGILYYQYANIQLNTIQLNQGVSVPSREALLFALVVDTSKNYVINQSGASVIIYNANLQKTISTELFDDTDDVLPGDPFELTPGTYYVVGTPTYCSKGGSFTLTEL